MAKVCLRFCEDRHGGFLDYVMLHAGSCGVEMKTERDETKPME